ncbi:MAG: c-type cytochrome [Alcaligenaceae bacterium]|nr:c-type cytochrome [Alcaligenaceae bacterium]
MSHEEHATESGKGHEGGIKTPRQLLITVILAFLIPIVIIMMLVNLVGAGIQTGAGSDGQTPEAIAKRIQPVAGFKLVDANAPKVFLTGQQVFESTCTACHTAGVAGAPKFGDKAAWAPLIKLGYEALIKNAINGIGAMPPKGGNASLSDFEVERAVVYIANHSGASFDEPKEPSAEAAPAAVATDAAAAAPAPAAQTAAAPAPTAAPTEAETKHPLGSKVYKNTCAACHDAGLAGALKIDDKDAWKPFIETGVETMLQNTINGVGAMPPRGGTQATDEEIKAAIEYMIDEINSEPAQAQAAPKAAETTAAAAPKAAEAAAPAAAEGAAVNAVGEKIYKSVCFACHAAGVAGAPKFGDKAAWEPFIKTGMDAMLKNAINGVGAMPPRGGSQASDEEIKAAIEYMVNAAS